MTISPASPSPASPSPSQRDPELGHSAQLDPSTPRATPQGPRSTQHDGVVVTAHRFDPPASHWVTPNSEETTGDRFYVVTRARCCGIFYEW